jgi:hypothetical protein
MLLLGTSMTAALVVRPSYAATGLLDSGVVIPLYNTPDSTWTTVAQAAQAYPNVPIVVIVNPDSGPGSSESSTFLSGIQSLQAAGVTVIGYVWSDYAGASLSSLESQISQWKSWYNVNGIFFDGMSNSASTSSYYASLNSYVMSDGMTYTMGNPGTSVPDSMLGIFTTTNIYENPGYPTIADITYAGYPTSEVSLMAYDVTYSASFVTSAASLVGYMYIDNQGGSNPYATLSSYFTETVQALALLDGSTTTSTSSTSSTSTTHTTTTTSTTSTTSSTTHSTTTSTTSKSSTSTTTTTTSSTPTTTTTTTSTSPSQGSGIALTNKASTSGTVSSSPYQITLANFNSGSGSNSLLVVGVSANNENVASVTFGGTSLRSAVGSFNNNDAEFWYLANPSGTGNIVVTMEGSTSAVVGAYALSGVDVADPIPTTAAASNTASSSPSITIATQYPDSWVLDLPSIWGGSSLGSATCTQQWNTDLSGSITGASSSHVTTSPGSVSCSWKASPADLWDDVAIEVHAATTTTTSTSTSTTTTTTASTTTSTTSTPTTTGTSTLKVTSENSAGTTITGYYTTLSLSGAVSASGYTPVTYTLTDGQTYTVQADSYGSCTFAHWQSGVTTNPVSITITSNTSLVAVYDCTTSAKPDSSSAAGSPAMADVASSMSALATVDAAAVSHVVSAAADFVSAAAYLVSAFGHLTVGAPISART